MTHTFRRIFIWMRIQVLTIGGMCCLDIPLINFDQIICRYPKRQYSYNPHREKAKSYKTLRHTWRICNETRENIN